MTTTNIPRPEYPRPQLVRADWINLNGAWEFELDQSASGEARGLPQATQLSQTITVPFCPESELSGIGNKDFMLCVWYRRTVAIPESWTAAKKRVLLHFGAVDYDATVWVNGQRAGTHRGGYVSFTLEITNLVKPGENVITVRVYDDTRSPLQPSGKQSPQYDSFGCMYTRTTGIWQTVWLEAVPATFVRTLKFYPDVNQGAVTLHAHVNGDSGGHVLRARVLAQGREAGQAQVAVGANGQVSFTVTLSERRLWQPGQPFLYDVELTLEKDGQPVDTMQSYFGLRDVRIVGKKVLINNVSVFQRLILDQGFYPDGIYTAPTDAALRGDIELSMAMGFNGARLHQKVFEERFLYWADKLGYIVWGEYPNWGLDHAHPLALERMLPEWISEVERDFNHPSIVGWCPFNETATTQNPELLRTIYCTTKALDATRPVIDTSGYVHVDTDIYDCHNYEQDPAKFAATYAPYRERGEAWRNFPDHDTPYQGQPYFVSEYGGIWWNPGQAGDKAWGYGNRPRSEEEFLARYRALTETLLNDPNMFAFCYTQLTNVEQEVNGLYTYERKAKFDPAIIHAINVQPAAIEQ